MNNYTIRGCPAPGEGGQSVAGGELFNGLFADEDDDRTFSGVLLFGAD